MSQVQKLLLHPLNNEVSGNAQGSDFENVFADGPGTLYVDVTARSGTNPTLNLVLQERDPEGGKYIDSGLVIAEITTVSINRFILPDLHGVTYRLDWTIGGTAAPNFTFSALLVVKDRG